MDKLPLPVNGGDAADADVSSPPEVVLSRSGSCERQCRICQSTTDINQLISPCQCKGTLRLVHKECIETWAEKSQVSRCEICRTQFNIIKSPKPFREWLRHPATSTSLRSVGVDLCWMLVCLTVLGLAAWLCTYGAYSSTSAVVRVSLLLLRVLLFVVSANVTLVFLTEIVHAVRHHYCGWFKWRNQNFRREIVGNEPPATNEMRNRQPYSFDTSSLICELPAVHRTLSERTVHGLEGDGHPPPQEGASKSEPIKPLRKRSKSEPWIGRQRPPAMTVQLMTIGRAASHTETKV